MAAGPRTDRTEAAIVRAMNARRAHHGLRRLHVSRALAHAADYHSDEMLRFNVFTHGAFDQRVRHWTRSRTIGETLAMISACSRGTARQVVSMWMHSPPHRAVLLSRAFHRVGVGRRSGLLGGAPACLVTADFASAR